MDAQVLIDSFTEFKEAKNIDRTTVMSIFEDIVKGMIRKRYGTSDNFDVIINPDKGDLEVLQNRTIVEDGMVEDATTQIAYSEAILIEPDFEVGEDVAEKIDINDFGRRSILA